MRRTRGAVPLTPDEVAAAADRAEGIKPVQPEGKHAGGRPAKYQEGFAKQAAKLCTLGATDEELADFFEVSIRTVANWKVRHPEFLQALKTGKDAADDRVERSLYQKAIGYSFDGEKVFQHQGAVVRAKTREHVPPDTTAAIFWLKNRRPEQWRDKVVNELSGKDGGPIETAARIVIVPPKEDAATVIQALGRG